MVGLLDVVDNGFAGDRIGHGYMGLTGAAGRFDQALDLAGVLQGFSLNQQVDRQVHVCPVVADEVGPVDHAVRYERDLHSAAASVDSPTLSDASALALRLRVGLAGSAAGCVASVSTGAGLASACASTLAALSACCLAFSSRASFSASL
ncbi:hypothetical protein 10RS306A_gene4585 [Ralstonia phage 10RS306A]|uniref:Uncharacterized protein n=1 Tax=Ralstonia phage 10RS306A TaxID=2968818 RepID=A0A977TES2_9CAUD|nr:hypothetical protein 10RS306A_gene4585 [Ralstonia phage 10RS306A]